MDYYILYSNFSEACASLFDMFSNLQGLKGICIDEPTLREQVIQKLNITVVPTLVLFTREHKVLQRIVGVEHIRNWLIIEHKLNAAGAAETPPEPEFFEPERSVAPAAPAATTSTLKKNARSIAEEMQKEREEILKNNVKNKQTL